MDSPLHAITDPDIGLRLHRPTTGWALAAILGIALGVHFGQGMLWLSLGTLLIGLTWVLARPTRALLLCLATLCLSAWYGAQTHDANATSWTRLTAAQESGEPIPLTATVANNCFVIERKYAAPYATFSLEDVTFEDGTPLSGARIKGFYYDADGPLPRTGERWCFYARIRSHVWYDMLHASLYGAPHPDKIPHRIETTPTPSIAPLTGEQLLDCLQQQAPEGDTFPLLVRIPHAPEIIARKRGGDYAKYTFTEAFLKDGRVLSHPKMTLYFYDKSGAFPQCGEYWSLPVSLRKNASEKSVTFSCKVSPPAAPPSLHLVEQDAHGDLRYRFAALRNRLASHLALGIPPEDALLTQTMTLGIQKRIPHEDMQRYADAGIIHIFSISGLHVGIIAGLLIWFLAWVGLRLRTRIFIILPALLGYLILTGIPPSAARACFMAILFCAAPCFMRRADATSTLLLTAVAALLYEPNWVSNVGALLSFTVMGGILLYMSPITYFANLLFHSRLRRTAIGELRLQYPWHFRIRRRLASLFGLTISAWLASIPLTLYFFERFSIVGTLLNLFIPTLTIFIVWLACVSALSGFFLPTLSILFNRINTLLLSAIEAICDVTLHYPWAIYEAENPPPLSLIIACELLLLFGGLYLRALEKRIRLRDPRDLHAYAVLLRASERN